MASSLSFAFEFWINHSTASEADREEVRRANGKSKKDLDGRKSGLVLTHKASWVGFEMIFTVLDCEPGFSVPDSIDKLNVILQQRSISITLTDSTHHILHYLFNFGVEFKSLCVHGRIITG